MLFWPVMDLMPWGLFTAFIQRQATGRLPLPIGFLLGGVLLWDIVFRSNLGIGTALLEDTSWSRNVLNFLVSPLRPSEYLAGAAMWSIAKVLTGWTIMISLAWILFAFAVFKVGVVLVLFAGALMLFGVALAMVVWGLVFRLGSGADILAWGLGVLLMPVSAVFYPVKVLPGWARAVASGVPTSHVFESMRTVLAGRPVPWPSLGAALALDVVYLAIGMTFAAAMFGTFRRRGYATRYM
jgi:ABC-2 type transport system permease protein